MFLNHHPNGHLKFTSLAVGHNQSKILPVEKLVWAPAPFHSPYSGFGKKKLPFFSLAPKLGLILSSIESYLHWLGVHCDQQTKVLRDSVKQISGNKVIMAIFASSTRMAMNRILTVIISL